MTIAVKNRSWNKRSCVQISCQCYLPGNLPGAAAPVSGEPGTSEALGPGEPSSPWRGPSSFVVTSAVYSWTSWYFQRQWHVEVADSICLWLAEKRNAFWGQVDNDCFSILAECPLVVVTELVVKRWSNGNSDRPLYILNTSSKSARLRLSSNVRNPRRFRRSSYCNDFSPGTIRVKRCCTRSSNSTQLNSTQLNWPRDLDGKTWPKKGEKQQLINIPDL